MKNPDNPTDPALPFRGWPASGPGRLMLAQGTPLHVVSEVLGQASIAITKDVYGHLLEGDGRAAAEWMSRALPGG
jgi:integrase